MPQPNYDHFSQPYRSCRERRRLHRRGGFTMIELLVVMGIIAILIAILVLVGGRVAGTGKQSATLSTIKTLEATLGSIIQERGRLPRAVVRDPRSTTGGERYWPIADALSEDTGPPGSERKLINSTGWFLELASGIPGSTGLQGLDPQLLRPYSPEPAGAIGSSADNTQPLLTTPIDGWGNPIRFVHPDFDGNMRRVDPQDVLGPAPGGGQYVSGVTVTRIGAVTSAGELDRLNADGGFAPGNQPYFYSAGPSGKVGLHVESSGEIIESFNEDNVYSAIPEFDRQPPAP